MFLASGPEIANQPRRKARSHQRPEETPNAATSSASPSPKLSPLWLRGTASCEDRPRGQRVIAGDRGGRDFAQDVAGSRAAANVLADVLLEVSVERFDAAGEGVSPVPIGQELDLERP